MSYDISIIIPWHNTPVHLLKRAVISALKQSSSPSCEVVIVDDGSDERLTKSVREWLRFLAPTNANLKVISLPTQSGVGAARNAGVDIADGDYLLWLDADDELYPETAQTLWETARRFTSPLTVADCVVLGKNGSESRRRSSPYFNILSEFYECTEFDPFYTTIFAIQPQLIAKNLWESVNGFNPSFTWGEITDLFLRCVAEVGRDVVQHVPLPLYRYYRVRSAAISQRHRAALEQFRRRALKEFAERQGQRGYELHYLGRGVSTGAQHYAPMTGVTFKVPPYLRITDSVGQEEPRVEIILSNELSTSAL